MEEKRKVLIFHIYRKDGSALFLHPFDNLNKFLEITKNSEIVGKYGTEPRVESLTLFRNDLYRLIEDAVKSWISEVKFIPRFIISTVVFLLAYFVSSFLIRDPLPILDEVLIALAAGIISYFLLNKKDQSSAQALKKRVELRTTVDRIVFNDDSFVKEVEEYLQRNESESKEKVLESMLLTSEKSFTIEDKNDAKQLLKYIGKKFNKKDIRKQEKLVLKLKNGIKSEKEVEKLSKWVEAQKVDISLFATYTRIKKAVRI